jgi:cytoskeletal protein RodZ
MVGFTRKKVESHTLGEKLKMVREDANVSLNEISKATKIRKIYLEKLENGKFDELPPEVYVRGFLKSYAKYLGIELSDVMRLYEKEQGIAENIKKLNEPKVRKKRIQLPSVTITPNVFAIGVFILLVLAGFVYFYQEVGKFSQEPRLVILQPTNNVSIEGNTVDIVGITEKDSKITINQQPVFVNEKGEFKETISLQQGVNELEIKSMNRFDNEAIKKINISSQYDSQLVSEDGTEKVMGASNQQDSDIISLEIKIEESPTWVSIEVDGTVAQEGTMLPGSIQKFEGEEKVTVTSGKANKTIVTLNGQELGPLGEETVVVRDVVFTKETKIMPQSSAFQTDTTDVSQEEND